MTPQSYGSRVGEHKYVHVEFVMGTAVSFDLRSGPTTGMSTREARGAIEQCARWLHWVDETFTTYNEGSWVRRLARQEASVTDGPGELAEVVELCDQFVQATGGWFDPWAGPNGFDPSGLVKGWATQRASDLLLHSGFAHHCVNAGGDVAARGAPTGDGDKWGVGISHPLVPRARCAVVAVSGEAVATSGTAERGLHVWNPKTRGPAGDLASVTVVCSDLTAADVYATAAFAMGTDAPAWIEHLPEVDGYLVDRSGHEWSTPGFAARRTWPPSQ